MAPAVVKAVVLLVVVIVDRSLAAEKSAKEEDKKLPTAALVEPHWSWRLRDEITCPPPRVFYSSCHMSSDYVSYRERHPDYHLLHEEHFRPVIPAGPHPFDRRPVDPPPREVVVDPPPREVVVDPPPREVVVDPPPRRVVVDPPPRTVVVDPPPRPPPKTTLVTLVAEEGRRPPADWWSGSYYGSQRGQFGKPLPDWREEPVHPNGIGGVGIDGCYRLQRRGARLENHILQVVQSRELRDCEEACNRDRRCVSFNFRADPVEIVCELTDMDSYGQYAQFKPISGWNFYERDTSSYCSGWDNNYYASHSFGYAYCSMRVRDNSLLSVSAIRRDISCRSLSDCEQACRDERQFRCETFSFGETPGGRGFSCQLTDLRISELSPRDMEPRRNFEIYDYHGNGRQCDRPNDVYDYRHGHLETCSGRSCARGPCRIDRSGGYWYCFTDSSEAVWDYCCDPDSPCQSDPQMDMNICHVSQRRGLYRNAGLDTAWRPCEYGQRRYAYLTRNTTDHVVDDDATSTAANDDSKTIPNQLLETIDLEQERSKRKN